VTEEELLKGEKKDRINERKNIEITTGEKNMQALTRA
jgi:hypothetical protein